MATGNIGMEAILERLTLVEREVRELRRLLDVQRPEGDAWYLKHAGVFKDDPEFEEVVRLGREIRGADRPE